MNLKSEKHDEIVPLSFFFGVGSGYRCCRDSKNIQWSQNHQLTQPHNIQLLHKKPFEVQYFSL
jgi:hypothetical protein